MKGFLASPCLRLIDLRVAPKTPQPAINPDARKAEMVVACVTPSPTNAALDGLTGGLYSQGP